MLILQVKGGLDMDRLTGTVKDDAVRLRRYSNNIRIGGIGIIIFSLWGTVKLFVSMALGGPDLIGLQAAVNDLDPRLSRAIFYFIYFSIYVLILGFHFYVGICAMGAGHMSFERVRFLIYILILAACTLSTIPSYLRPESNGEYLASTIASFMLDVTFSFILLDMFYSSVRIRMLKKKTTGGI